MSDAPKRPEVLKAEEVEWGDIFRSRSEWIAYARALEADRDAWKARAEKAEAKPLLPGLRMALEIAKGCDAPQGFLWYAELKAKIQEAINEQG